MLEIMNYVTHWSLSIFSHNCINVRALFISFYLLACLVKAGDSKGGCVGEGAHITVLNLREEVVQLTVAVSKALKFLSRDLHQWQHEHFAVSQRKENTISLTDAA